MKIIADLHIHSRYSRATSQRMNIGEIAKFAKIKGLTLIGTGDFTHPKWFNEIRENLALKPSADLYQTNETSMSPVYFMLTTEVCTIFNFENQSKKIHHVIFTPTLEIALQINEVLRRYGNLGSDGRPILSMTAAHLVEEVMAISNENLIFPAHIWTPWFSLFGAFSGFDNIEDCYQDMTKHIFAVETGLSSDPPMNWRLSKLDRFTLLSNSDCHSFWPWRIGREANVFELEETSYNEVVNTIRKKDTSRLKFTIETDPAYGKYHWSGHRNCGVSLPPEEARKFNNICPVCRKQITKGVDQRVEELADRPVGFVPTGSPGFKKLLPLSDIIAAVLGADSPSTKAVWNIYNSLINKFGNEFAVLLDTTEEDLMETVDPAIAMAILQIRKGLINVIPGYDGEYGRLVLGEGNFQMKLQREKVRQFNITDFL